MGFIGWVTNGIIGQKLGVYLISKFAVIAL